MQENQPDWVKRIGLIMVIMSGCAHDQSSSREELYRIGTGIYDNRIEESEGRFEEMRHLQREAQQNRRRLAADKAQQQNQINELDAQLFQLIQETHQLATQLAKLKPKNPTVEQKKALLSQQLQQINTGIEQLQRDSLLNRAERVTHQNQLIQLDKKVRQLQDTLHTLP